MKLSNLYRIFAVFGLMILAVACDDDGVCRRDRYVAMGVKFFRTTFDEYTENYKISEFLPDSVVIFGLGRDSVLFNVRRQSSFDLPLQKIKNQTQFVIITNGKNDTLKITHENINNYLSMECGCIVFAEITEASSTTNLMDSVVVKIPLVENVKATNLEIYFK